MSKSRATFSIATLLVVTAVIAIHCAFPFLFNSLFYTCIFGTLLTMLVFPIFAIVVLSSSSAKGQLDVWRNTAFRSFVWLYALLLLLIYALMVYREAIGSFRYYD